MAHFIFKAKRPNGEIYISEKDAADRYDLYRLIRDSGDEIVSVKEKRSGHSGLNIVIFNRVKTSEKINFARNLGSMLSAGLSLSRALSVLEKQSKNKKLKKVINGISGEVSRGTTFSDALKQYPKVFPQLFVSMVHAGEQSGGLAESLKIIAMQMENSHELERRVRGALIYPAIVLFIMTVIGILMFIFVVPTLMKTFTEFNVQLPLSTRVILGISDIISGYGLALVGALLVAAGGVSFWSRTAMGRNVDHELVLKVPILGPLVKEVNAARTARTLSSLLSAGVDAVESLSITAEVVQNVHFKKVLAKAKNGIKSGETMSKIFAEGGGELYPSFFSEMLGVGEETGKIGEMLMGVAVYYENEIELKTKNMSTIIEPVLMVVIAAAVGFFAVSMISPIYSLVNAI